MAIPRNLANFAPKLDSSGNPTFTAPTVFSAGTASLPSITFTGDTNTGIFSPGADTIAFTEGGAEAMRIDSSGNVGIGTSSPLAKLDVVGTDTYFRVRATNGSSAQTLYQNSDTGTSGNDGLYVGIDGSEIGYLWNFENQPLAFGTNNTERARITSGGDLLVNTTGLPIDNGIISGNTTTNKAAGRFYSSGGDGNLAVTIDKSSNTNTTSQWFLGFTINAQSTASGVITANGASQAAFGSYSDKRLKENIVDLPPQLANICALRPVEFDYIQSEGGGHQISFIAQEFEQVYPDAIGERFDGMKTLTGWGKTEAYLVKAIQELSAKNDALEARLAALEAK